MQDQEIINRILRNDDVGFAQLLRRYQNLVYTTCLRLLSNKTDAEDLSQEVFLEVFRSIEHLKNTDDMSGWIYRIAYTKCISYMRRKIPGKASPGNDPEQVTQQMENATGDSQQDSPQRTLEQKEAAAHLFKKIDKLPEKQKRAFLMHKFEGYSHKEICEAMSLSQASVESLIYRAKTSLKKSLVNYFENY
jgi:RNA polymerase sigma factor (sigma-70 family)